MIKKIVLDFRGSEEKLPEVSVGRFFNHTKEILDALEPGQSIAVNVGGERDIDAVVFAWACYMSGVRD